MKLTEAWEYIESFLPVDAGYTVEQILGLEGKELNDCYVVVMKYRSALITLKNHFKEIQDENN